VNGSRSVSRAMLTAGVLCGVIFPIPAADSPEVTATVNALRARRQTVGSVRFEVVGRQEHTAAFLGPDARAKLAAQPGHTLRSDEKMIALIDVTGKRVRLDRTTAGLDAERGALVPLSNVLVYDGSACDILYKRTENTTADHTPSPTFPDLSRDRQPKSAQRWMTPELLPLYWGVGVLNLTAAPPRAKDWLVAPEADELVVHGRADYGGRPCVVLRTPTQAAGTGNRTDEVWVDPGRDWAPVKHVWLTNGKPVVTLEAELGRTDRGWLPTAWKHALYLNGKLAASFSFRVTATTFDVSVSDTDFRHTPVAGMYVLDGYKEYRVDSSGRLDQVRDRLSSNDPEGPALREALATRGLLPPEEPIGSHWQYVGSAVLGVLAVVGIFFLVRWWRR
jgi:hypothetical protein